MKTGWDHAVPLSRQALAILRSVQKLTGHRRYVFSCSKDAPGKCFLTSPCLLCPPMRCMHAFGRQLPIRGRLFINFMIEKLSGLEL
jgi:hypothetical protein